MTRERFSTRAARLGGETSTAWALQDEALARACAGEKIMFLTVGDPDQSTPTPIVDAATRALANGRTHYSPAAGEPVLRATVAARATRDTGRQTAAENVIVYPGGQSALFGVVSMLLDAGDEVIVPEPFYATYPGVVAAAGARMVAAPTQADAGFIVDIAAIASRVTPRTRAILLSSPNNPAGSIVDAVSLRALARLSRDLGIWLVADEVYSHFVYAGAHASAWSFGDPALTVVVDSVSKTYAMSGWRLGWALAPPDLVLHLSNLAEAAQFACSQFVQDAAIAALSSDLPELVATREEYRTRRDFIVSRVQAIPGLRAVVPAGGMFVMLDVRGVHADDVAFSRALLRVAGVAVIPGSGFGPSARGHVRVSLTQPLEVFERAFVAIRAFVDAVRSGREAIPVCV